MSPFDGLPTPSPTPRRADAHVAGWRYQMSVFGDVVTRDQHAWAPGLIDRWRSPRSAPTTSPSVIADHIAAARMHLPARLDRHGDVEHAHGIALVRWRALRDGAADPVARGTTIFDLCPDGRIARVTGLWS